jgi:multisubunit Na+/H+ antiporter MnhB subunit
MLTLATPLVKWDDVLRILLAGLIGAVGVVVIFGFLLLALSRARDSEHESTRLLDYALAGVCGLLCVGAVGIGIYAIVHKPKSLQSKSKGKSKIALVQSASRDRVGVTLIASRHDSGW